MADANQTAKSTAGKQTGGKAKSTRKAAGTSSSAETGTTSETFAADAVGAAAGSANAAGSPRDEAKSRFNAALEEARAGAAALRNEATERAAAYRTQAKTQGEDWVAEAKAYGEQARGRAGELAVEGKGKVAEALSALGRAVFDTAPTVDEKLGARYGDYARTASRSLQDASTRLDTKSVDELGEDAREFVRKSPGLAVGIAAVGGFLLARMFRGSND